MDARTLASLLRADMIPASYVPERNVGDLREALRTKASYGTSANAVKIHVWVAIRGYVLVAIVKKRLGLSQSLYTVLQVLSVTLFEKVPIQQALALMPDTTSDGEGCNPLLLFDR